MAVTDEIIVALAEGDAAESFFAGDGRFADYRPLDGTPDQFVATLADRNTGRATVELANTLPSDPRVQWATPNFYQDWQRFFTPNDPLFGQQWHLNNTGQRGGTPNADIDAPQAWDITPGGSASITVAIVDDGIELSHPDLAANMFRNLGEVANNGIDDDGNGWIDDTNGWNFTQGVNPEGNNQPGASDMFDMHGTSTAGLSVGIGHNGLGTTGAAY